MTRRSIGLAVVAALALATPLTAQEPGPRAAERLRREFEERFANQIRLQLGLSEQEAARVNQVLAEHAIARRQLEVEEQAHRALLNRHLRPGIAAHPDSVTRAVDRIAEVRVLYMQSMQEELRHLSQVLTPVQRAQFFLLRDRVLQRAQELRDQRGRGVRPPLADRPAGGP